MLIDAEGARRINGVFGDVAFDALIVAAQRTAKPNGGSAFDHHFADNIGVRRNPSVGCDVGTMPI